MKDGIHPNYHPVQIICACGSSFESKSTVTGDVIRVEICKNCHPFYTGKHKVVDTSGRIDLFKNKYNL